MGLLAAWMQVSNSLRQLASALNDANGDPGHRCRWEPDEEGTLAAPQLKAPRRALVDPNISSNAENVPAAPETLSTG